jgi:hypothetical protein
MRRTPSCALLAAAPPCSALGVDPAGRGRLGGLTRLPREGPAAEDEDDLTNHVLVDTRQVLDGHVDAGLLGDLATDAALEGLIELEDSARCLPTPVVPALDHQDAAVVVDDHPATATA